MGLVIRLLLVIPFVYGAAIFAAQRFGGEVVELETHDVRGGDYAVSLWTIDLQGDVWLRAGSPDATWLARIREAPDVHVSRAGVRQAYRAEIVPDYGSRVNVGMREKYGWADQVVATLFDEDEVVAIRLLPRWEGTPPPVSAVFP